MSVCVCVSGCDGDVLFGVFMFLHFPTACFCVLWFRVGFEGGTHTFMYIGRVLSAFEGMLRLSKSEGFVVRISFGRSHFFVQVLLDHISSPCAAWR